MLGRVLRLRRVGWLFPTRNAPNALSTPILCATTILHRLWSRQVGSPAGLYGVLPRDIPSTRCQADDAMLDA